MLLNTGVIGGCWKSVGKTKFQTQMFWKESEKKNTRFYREIARQKLAYAGHELRWSGGRNAAIILEGKIKDKKTKGRPKRMWFDDIMQAMDNAKRLWWS